MARSFDFCVLKYRPDPRRGEVVNIGIVIFFGEQLDVRLLESFGKAQALSPGVSFDSLATLPGRLNYLTSGINDNQAKRDFLARFGQFTASGLGQFDIALAEDYESEVARLLVDLVLPPRSLKTATKRIGQLRRSVKERFQCSGLLGLSFEDIHAHKVIASFPISEPENLFADFAFKNGKYRFAQIVDLNTSGSNNSQKFKECCEKALVLDKARREFGGDASRIVLFSAPEDRTAIVDSSINLLSDYATEILNADSEDDLASFFDVFASTSHAGARTLV
jgi:hypothetical protein